MSSVHRQPGRPYWYCSFTGADGLRKFKSTKTANKKAAIEICSAWSKAATLARRKTLTPDRARHIIESGVSEILEASGAATAPRRTVDQFLTEWLSNRDGVMSPSTVVRYKGVITGFLKWMGASRHKGISSLTQEDIEDYRKYAADRVSATTVNVILKVLRVALKRGVPKYFSVNPATHVENLDASNRKERRPFTMDELRLLMRNASIDWQSAILVGLYTGFRLADCANLTWANVDPHGREFVLKTQKTGRLQRVPIHRVVMDHLEALSENRAASDPICPALHGKPPSTLSSEFYSLMATSGIVAKRDHSKSGSGRDGKRRFSEITFHSLRHTATSWLKNSGVSEVVAMDLIGHESASVSRNYTTIDAATKRAAVDKMPDVTQ